MIDDPVLVNDWHPVAHIREFDQKNPLAVRVLEEDLVVWRAGDQIMAWQDLCVHRGTRLSLGKVDGERLECPYHGWTYNTEGRCVLIPAHPGQAPPTRARTKTYQVCVGYELVWVCLGEPRRDLPPFPEWANAGYRKLLAGPYRVQASGPRIIENFLDVGHFPFVHEGILGARERPEIQDYESEIGPEGVESKGVRVYQPDPYGTGQGDVVHYTYRAYRPLTAYLNKESETNGFSILLVVTPHAKVESTAWMWMAMNYGHDLPAEDLIAYQDRIFMQDQPIVQSQRPELLPLDLQAELHLRSDRTAIAYRQWLKQLGLTFGAS